MHNLVCLVCYFSYSVSVSSLSFLFLFNLHLVDHFFFCCSILLSCAKQNGKERWCYGIVQMMGSKKALKYFIHKRIHRITLLKLYYFKSSVKMKHNIKEDEQISFAVVFFYCCLLGTNDECRKSKSQFLLNIYWSCLNVYMYMCSVCVLGHVRNVQGINCINSIATENNEKERNALLHSKPVENQ